MGITIAKKVGRFKRYQLCLWLLPCICAGLCVSVWTVISSVLWEHFCVCVSLWTVFCVSMGIDILYLCGHFCVCECVFLWTLVSCVSVGIDILCLCGHFCLCVCTLLCVCVFVCVYTFVCMCVCLWTLVSCVCVDTCASFKMIKF